MTSDTIILTEGEAVTYTITLKKAGAVVDLTSVTDVFLYVKDDDVAEGTNIVDGVATVIDGDPTTGQVSFAFTTGHSAIASGRVVQGRWACKADTEWYDEGCFRIEKNAFTA